MPAKNGNVANENGYTNAPPGMEDRQYTSYKKLPDEIVISGFSGRLPESSTIEEFKSNLFDGIDMVNDEPRRWPDGLYGMYLVSLCTVHLSVVLFLQTYLTELVKLRTKIWKNSTSNFSVSIESRPNVWTHK